MTNMPLTKEFKDGAMPVAADVPAFTGQQQQQNRGCPQINAEKERQQQMQQPQL